jgi:nucleoid-associated protein YgaU
MSKSEWTGVVRIDPSTGAAGANVNPSNPPSDEMEGEESESARGRFARYGELFNKIRWRKKTSDETSTEDGEEAEEQLAEESDEGAAPRRGLMGWFRRRWETSDDQDELEESDEPLDPSMCDEPVQVPAGWKIPKRVALAGGLALAALSGVGLAHQFRQKTKLETQTAEQSSTGGEPTNPLDAVEDEPTPAPTPFEREPESLLTAVPPDLDSTPPLPDAAPAADPLVEVPPATDLAEELPPLIEDEHLATSVPPAFVDPNESKSVVEAAPPIIDDKADGAEIESDPFPSHVAAVPLTSSDLQTNATDTGNQKEVPTTVPVHSESISAETIIPRTESSGAEGASFRFPAPEEHARWVAIPRGGSRARVAPVSRSESVPVTAAHQPTSSAPSTTSDQWTRHVVLRGENFWTIARKYYGSGDAYRSLWLANREQVPLIDELYVGTEIVIPPKSQIMGPAPIAGRVLSDPAVRRRSGEISAPADPIIIRSEPTGAEARPAKVRKAEDRVHLVGQNETLRSIARSRLGDPNRADELLELNRERIEDPKHLKTDTLLVLPPN